MSAVMNSARRSITSPSLPIWEEGRPADPGRRWRSRPVSRILYPGRQRTGGPGGGHLSWSRIAATARPTPPHPSIGGDTPALVEQFGAGLGPDVVHALPGQPLIDSLIGQTVGLA